MGKNMRDRNIKFSGLIKGSGEEFLWLFTEAIKQYGLTEDETFQIIPFILEMPALAWYRAEENKMRDYSDFIELFRKRFSSSDCQAKLWEEIRAREMVENKLRCMAQYAPPPPPEKSMLSSSAWSRNNGRKSWGMAATESKEEINATESAPVKNNMIKNPQIKPKQAKTLATQTESISITPAEKMVCYNWELVSGTVDAATDPPISNETRKAVIIPVTQEVGTGTEDLVVVEEKEKIDAEINCVGAAYDEESSDDYGVISTSQFFKILGGDCGENRKFTTVRLGNESFKALIDTGATRTFVGPSFGKMVKEHTINAGGMMRVADGSEVKLLGCVILKLEAHMEKCTIPVRICSVLSYDVVLGMDFIAAMGVEFRGDNCTWKGGRVKIDTQSNIVYARAIRIDERLMLVEASQDISPSEADSPHIVNIPSEVAARMRETFKKLIPPEPKILRITPYLKHNIDVQGHPPIRQGT
ncbi:hypothetical protein PV326_000461, partial [Microctonus aethiopoides]